MQLENNLFPHLQEAVVKTVAQCCHDTWGYDIQDNGGFALDLRAIADMQNSHELHILYWSVTTNGVEIQVSVDDAVTSLAEVKHAVYRLLGLVAEEFLVILPRHSHEALRYWFMTGSATHGHLGEIIIQRQNVSHVDLSGLDHLLSNAKNSAEI